MRSDAWRPLKAAHESRVDAWTAPHLDRASRREKHPVEDFLFGYYTNRPSRLRRWSPGAGVVLEDWDGEQPWNDPVPDRLGWVVDLLRRTSGRAPAFGCFGLHEWAMVYRSGTRHDVPLRLGEEGTAAVVEAQALTCTHHDAFRFFAPAARTLNRLQPSREDQLELEQPGCLHANMDLYKWAYKLSPWIRAELVADCFDLARRIRELDMRASPYDLSSLGYPAVPIETPEGRSAYSCAQRAFADEARALRERLLVAATPLVRTG
ncbi:MAG: 3-methyladenine glycosylase [Frankiales bacterium]|nr:3-methyladenine glycosylase [Frankiales bacterium]